MDKKIALAAALAASFSGSALAADLPSKKAPVVAPPALSWTGFYVGANAGGLWSGNNSGSLQVYGGAPALSAIPVGRNVFNSYGGFIGGGQVGYNYQLMQSFLIGAEADIQGIAGNASAANFTGASASAGITYNTIGKASSNLQYIGTVRGRVGYLVTPTLLLTAQPALLTAASQQMSGSQQAAQMEQAAAEVLLIPTRKRAGQLVEA